MFVNITFILVRHVEKIARRVTGILGSDDEKAEEYGDDEILTELKKKQAELKAISHQNSVMLRFLHKQAKEELQKQDLRKKMVAADTEVSVMGCFEIFPLVDSFVLEQFRVLLEKLV